MSGAMTEMIREREMERDCCSGEGGVGARADERQDTEQSAAMAFDGGGVLATKKKRRMRAGTRVFRRGVSLQGRGMGIKCRAWEDRCGKR